MSAKAKIQEVTFDCADAEKLAAFYGKLLDRPWGYRPAPGGVVNAGGLHLLFQVVPEPKSSPKNRLHLDIEVDDISAGIARAEVLGATRIGEFHADPAGGGYVVMQDPEANEFCLVFQPEGSWTELLDAIVSERDQDGS
jgi:predicted enzyme related to lactoylglutathione lyase